MIALELARRFIAEGDEVSHLFQIDASWRSVSLARWFWAGTNLVGNLMKWDLLKKIRMFDRYPLGLIRWVKMPLRKKLLALGRRLKLTTAGSSDPNVLGVQGGVYPEVLTGLDYSVYMLSSVLHEARPLDVPSTLYFAEDALPLPYRERYARRALLNATCESIPGNHTTCITRHPPASPPKRSRKS